MNDSRSLCCQPVLGVSSLNLAAPSGAAFFRQRGLFRREARAVASEQCWIDREKFTDCSAQAFANVLVTGRMLDALLVEVEAATDFDLQRVHVAIAPAMQNGRIAARIRRVTSMTEALMFERDFGSPRHQRRSGHAIAIAQNDVGNRCGGRHRVAIDDDGDPEHLKRFADQLRQGGMIRAIKPGQAQLGFARRELGAVDFRTVAHDARNDAEAGRNARAWRIDGDGKTAVEHRAVDFGRGAIDVEKRSGKARRDHRRAQRHRTAEQFVDEGIFGAAQRDPAKPAHGHEAFGIVATRMRRGEHEGHGLAQRTMDPKGLMEQRRQSDIFPAAVTVGAFRARLGHGFRFVAFGVSGPLTGPNDQAALRASLSSFTGGRINCHLRFADYTIYLGGTSGAMAHILLAEDDESLRKFLTQALVRAGHAVTDFGDGSDAYECLKGFRFDLLLTDIVMPGMDGIELAKRAAEMNEALKIMFITGFAAVALHPSSNAPKKAKVLSKPFHLREIVAEVDRMIAA